MTSTAESIETKVTFGERRFHVVNGIAVPALRETIVPPQEDASGQVVVPAIDRSTIGRDGYGLDTALMPNGQPLNSFYPRDEYGKAKFGNVSKEIMVAKAIARARNWVF